MQIFFDSSALAKKYISESGSDKVLSNIQKAKEVVVSLICMPEILSAANRLKRENKFNYKNYILLKQNILNDFDFFSVIDINFNVLDTTIICLERGNIRTLDALQIASAVVSNCELFVTADIRQKAIARKMGLKVLFV